MLAVMDKQDEAYDDAVIRATGPEHERLSDEWRLHQLRMIALERFIVSWPPSTPAEAVIVLMIAAGEINIGNSSEDGKADVERAEFAVRRATRVLADALAIDLSEFGADRYMPAHLKPFWDA